jgi:tetratricopeptide (TPR) repeat protein
LAAERGRWTAVKPGDVVAERFEILRLAGSGGMGSVWRARDRTNGGDVALKVVHTQNAADAERLRREAMVLAEIESPRVVRYVAHGVTDDGLPFLAMEWLEGETLEDRMIRSGLQVGEALLVCRGIAEGLAVLHARKFLHRDIKPSNVLLQGRDLSRATLLDLGIARLPTTARRATLTGTTIGTPGYMAPEQARGAKALDARVDVFALGCVLFECLTGTPAFVGESAMAVLAKVLFEETPRVMAVREDIPAEIEAFVQRLMAKAPEMRLADGAAVLAAMDSLPAIAIDAGAPPTSLMIGRAITGGERKLVSVVMAMVPEPVADPKSAPTLASGSPPARRTDVHAVAQSHGAEVEQLAMGVVVATIRGREGATDQALAAARCALALRAILPHAAMAIATGLGELATRIPVGEAIDRATKLLELGTDGIRIDETTAGLLPGSFGISGDASGLVLVGLREDAEAVRTLLGKPTPFVGREREVATLMATARQCFDERVSRVCLVTGPAGAGKSRLRTEIVKAIRDESPELERSGAWGTSNAANVELWFARADAVSRGSPFSVLAQIVRSAMNLGQGESLAIRQQKLRARIARRARPGDDPVRIGSFLGELADVPFPDDIDVRLRAARSDTIVMGDQIRRAFDEWMAAECERGPVAILLEDLHWGDLPSVELLDAILRRNAERPLLVIAFARPEIHEAFPGLWRERDVQELRLAPLTKRATEKLVRDLLPKAEHEDIARIVERGAGNPFYVEELVRAFSSGAALPLTVLAMIEARFERLDPETRRVLRATSVFGQHAWRNGVAALLGGASRAHSLDDHLGALEREEILSRHPVSRFAGETEYAFRHALVRDAAEATLTEDDARTAHALCAEWLEDHGETDAVQLADHHERGATTRAAYWLCRAAREALEGNDYGAAIARAERAMAAGAAGDVLGDALRVTCEAHLWRDDNEAAVSAGLRALKQLAPGSDAFVLACGDVALGAHRAGDDARVAAIGAQLAPLLAPIDRPSAAQVIGTARVASRLFAIGAVEPGDALLAWIDARVGRQSGDAVLGWIHSARAMRAAWTGALSTEIGELREASLAFEAAGDARSASYSLHNAGYALCHIGELEAGEAALVRAMRLSDQLGLRGMVLSCKANLGIARARLGDVRGALAVEREAVDGFRALGSRRDEATARVYLGIILRNLPSELEAAEREVRTGIAILPDSPVLAAAAYGGLATVLLVRGKPDEALAAALEGQRLFERAGGVVDGESLFRLSYAEALHAAGRIEEAREAIAVAKKSLLERAERIDDPKWRKSFLERIGEHARTFARATEWNA